jgi:uncharacterized membrane-anchored protein
MKLLLAAIFMLLAFVSFAKEGDKPKKPTTKEEKEELRIVDSIEKSMKYQTGIIQTANGVATLNVPSGFKFLDKDQSEFVIEKVWGNPPQKDILGLIFPKDATPFSDKSFAFVVSYDESGYVKDKDADKIDYGKMMKELKEEEPEINKQRKLQGYEAINTIGWAQTPYYDKTKKVLHWAKELSFNEMQEHTLNYDVRVLGRKGVLSLNAIAGITELGLVKQNIDSVLNIAKFNKGYTYEEFDSKTDKVAAYTIGGLVGAKVLAKVGLLAKFGKFFAVAWKFILLGIVGLWGVIKKFFTRKKEEEYEYVPSTPNNNGVDNSTDMDESTVNDDAKKETS